MSLPSLKRIAWKILHAFLLGPAALFWGEHWRKVTLPQRAGLSASLLLYYILLSVLPLHWIFVVLLHVVCSAWVQYRLSLAPLNAPGDLGASSRQPSSGLHAASAICVTLVPVIYLCGMGARYLNISTTGLYLPQSVFTHGFLWVVYSLPALALVWLVLWKSEIRFSSRHVLFFYLGSLLVLCVPFVGYYFLQKILESQFVNPNASVLFGYPYEARYRSWIFRALLLVAVVVFIPYLINANTLRRFGARAARVVALNVFLLLNLMAYTQETGLFLTALRQWAFDTQHFGVYKLLAQSQLARTPRSIESPRLLNQLAEYRYQRGQEESAYALWEIWLEDYGKHPAWGNLRRQVDGILQKRTSEEGADSSILLEVPTVQVADYLTLDWYGVLSAIAFHHGDLNDLELKEKLLQVFSLQDHQLPLVDNIPELLATLRRLGVPASAVFQQEDFFKSHLAHGRIPLVYYNYTWIPITGYDARRDGYYYYDYANNTRHQASSKGGDSELIFGKGFGNPRSRLTPYSYMKFMPARELRQHMENIGGIATVVGDMPETHGDSGRAAYLVELGDLYYQRQNNFYLASKSYAHAFASVPNWIVIERMAFLRRYYERKQSELDPPQSLFVTPKEKSEVLLMPLGDSLYWLAEERVHAGKAGWIIMEQWLSRPPLRTEAQLDSALRTYQFLAERDPHNVDYLDSLARLTWEKGDWIEAEAHYKKLLGMYFNHHGGVSLRLAWLQLLLDKVDNIPQWLALSENQSENPKYMTLQGALALHRGDPAEAKSWLEESLKRDKTISQTHALLAEYYAGKNDSLLEKVHRVWQQRTGELYKDE